MWEARFSASASDYLKKHTDQAPRILKGIRKVLLNPEPRPLGLGVPLGSHGSGNLSGFMKIKFSSIGVRVVYCLVRNHGVMNVVVIGIRDEATCYKEAARLVAEFGDRLFDEPFQL
jgi:hypothetical protein